MNREDIIKLAREAGMQGMLTDVVTTFEELERFANLVADAERESILHTVDELTDDRHPMFVEGYHLALHHIGQCIEGRGKD